VIKKVITTEYVCIVTTVEQVSQLPRTPGRGLHREPHGNYNDAM